VEKANESTPNSPPVPAPLPSAVPQSVSHRFRWYGLIGLALLLACLAGGIWISQSRSIAVPAIPEFNLGGADPEVAEAITAARTAVVNTPRSSDTWGLLAMTLHAHGYRNDATLCYAVAGTLEEENPLWPYLHGIILQNGTEPEAALPYLERAANLTPPNSMPRLALADMQLELGRLEESAAHFQKVLKVNPDDAHAQLGLGQLAIAQKQYKESLNYLQAIAENPYARKRSCALRATVYERLGDASSAKTERLRLTRLPDDAPWPDPGLQQVNNLVVGLTARLQKANSLGSSGRVDQAFAVLRETSRRYPQSDVAAAALGGALLAKKDYAGAELEIHRSTQLAPEQPEHWQNLGIARQEQSKFKTAAEAYRKSAELRPKDASTYYKLGECLQELGDTAGAVDAFRQALRHKPDMSEARQRLEKLTAK
jgi:tetratricopeptide (TPR) repeat protein